MVCFGVFGVLDIGLLVVLCLLVGVCFNYGKCWCCFLWVVV